MSISQIRQFFETALVAITDPTLIDTAYENLQFTGVDGKPYQEIFLMMAKSQNPQINGGFHRDLGYLQVNLNYPMGVGTGVAQARADAIIAAFPAGRSFVAAKITLTVWGTPYLSPARRDGNRWSLPVKIPFFANVVE